MRSIRLVCILLTSLLASCVKNADIYTPPSQSGQPHAVLRLDNASLLGMVANPLIMKPTNSFNVRMIDGKRISPFFMGNQIRLHPGNHSIVAVCSVNNRDFGEKTFNMHAVAGKTYTMYYPAHLHMNGYWINFRACEQLSLK